MKTEITTKFDALEMMIETYKNLIEWTEKFKDWFVDSYYNESVELNKFVEDILKLCEKRETKYSKKLTSLFELYDSYGLIKPVCEENNFNFYDYFEYHEGAKVDKFLNNLNDDLNKFNEFIQVWDTKRTHKNRVINDRILN